MNTDTGKLYRGKYPFTWFGSIPYQANKSFKKGPGELCTYLGNPTCFKGYSYFPFLLAEGIYYFVVMKAFEKDVLSNNFEEVISYDNI